MAKVHEIENSTLSDSAYFKRRIIPRFLSTPKSFIGRFHGLKYKLWVDTTFSTCDFGNAV